jgi:hypothetical protein
MQIHLIAFDIPFPANYGGAIDVFYKLKKLYEWGYKVTLHCFQYHDRVPDDHLAALCEKVYYYPRPLGLAYFLTLNPYIVATRNHKSLLNNLLKDNNPIFIEGIHCTFFCHHPALSHRRKIIRMHNIESKYYRHLASLEQHYARKFFFMIEAWKLKRYEKKLLSGLDKNSNILCISPNDFEYLHQLGVANLAILPAFHPFDRIKSKPEKGNYILFHANLAIADNDKSALFLVEKVFSNTNWQFKIAGNQPSILLKNIVAQYDNIELIENPTDLQMEDLIANAQINLLWSMQAEGIKLKLFYALCLGRFIIANKNIVENTGVENYTLQADTPFAIHKAMETFYEQPLTTQQIEQRKRFLSQYLYTQKEVLETSLSLNSIL